MSTIVRHNKWAKTFMLLVVLVGAILLGLKSSQAADSSALAKPKSPQVSASVSLATNSLNSTSNLDNLVGTLVPVDFFGEQQLIEDVELGFLRFNIGQIFYQAFLDSLQPGADPFDWTELDTAITGGQNSARTVLLTIFPRIENGLIEGKPGIPDSTQEVVEYKQWISALVGRYWDDVDYWQLDNEVSLKVPWNNNYDIYAQRLIDFYDEVKLGDPSGVVVLAGFGIGKKPDNTWKPSSSPRDSAAILLDEIKTAYEACSCPNPIEAIDVHQHEPWDEANKIEARLTAPNENGFISYMEWRFPGHDFEILITENSTWFSDANGEDEQSQREQAAFASVGIFSALGAGAEFSVSGVVKDREKWNNACLHVFALNGLYLNEDKTAAGCGSYPAPTPPDPGAKSVAHVTGLLGYYSIGRTGDDFDFIEPDADLIRYPIGQTGPSPIHDHVKALEVVGGEKYGVIWYVKPTSSNDDEVQVEIYIRGQSVEVEIVETVPNEPLPAWPPSSFDAAFTVTTEDVDPEYRWITYTLQDREPILIIPQ